MLENVFQAVLVMSGMGALLGSILFLSKPLLQKKFSASWCYYIWVLVLAAMLVPMKVDFADILESRVVRTVCDWTEEKLHLQEITDLVGEKLHLEEIRQAGVELLTVEEPKTDANGHRLVSPRLQEKRIREIAFERNLTWMSNVWFAGAVFTLMLRLVGYVCFLRKIRKNTESCIVPQVVYFTCRRIQVRRGECVYSPMLFGVFRPVLLLPVRELNEEQLQNVLAHEMTHLRRNDILLKWVMMMIKSIHWFNPMVYLIDRQLEQECEISCDVSVTKYMSGEQKKAYANTILTFFMGQKKREFSLSMGMAGTGGLLKKRFLRMKSAHPTSRMVKVLTCALTFTLLLGTVTVGSNLMNQTFPYEGDRSVMGVEIPDCQRCQVRTVYKCWVETAVFNNLLNDRGTGIYKKYVFQCPECLRQEFELQFLREFTEIERKRFKIYLENDNN